MRTKSGSVSIEGRRLRPTRPRDVGVQERIPEMFGIAGARVLANEAHDVLTPRGFSDEQLRLWAESYIVAEHTGDLDSFLDWIEARERGDREAS